MAGSKMFIECILCKQKVLLAKSFGFWNVDLVYDGESIEDFLNEHIHGKMDDVHFVLIGED